MQNDQQTKKADGYTSNEQMIAHLAVDALRDLDQAVIMMERSGFKTSTDKNLRLLYIGCEAALKSQRQTYQAGVAITVAPTVAQMNRLPEWSGFPDDPDSDPKQDSSK